MFEKIYIDGFRHFKNFSFEPYAQDTLLSGFNGTGKTTIVEIVNRLQLFLINNFPVTSLCQSSDIPRWDLKEYGNTTTTFELITVIDSCRFSYSIKIRHNLKESICRVQEETLYMDSASIFRSIEGNATVVTDDSKKLNYPVDWSFTGLTIAGRSNSKIRQFLQYVHKNIFAISLNPYAISSEHQEPETIIDLWGSNFSAWYDYLLNEQITLVASTFSEIKLFIPGFKQFAFDKEGKSKELVADIFISSDQEYRLPFKNLSHGQKILCILHLLIKIAPKDSIIMIDEFENFLSPTELQPLFDAAQDVVEEKNVQFIFVSHHPKTMNWFQNSAFILSFSGTPSFVRIKKFIPDENITIDEHLITTMEN